MMEDRIARRVGTSAPEAAGVICFAVASLLAALAIGCAGCGNGGPDVDGGGESGGTPRSLLLQVRETYQEADEYSDQGLVRLTYQRDGHTFEETAPLAVAFRRPDQLLVQAYQARILCNGPSITARILDAETGNLDGQVLLRERTSAELLMELYYLDPMLTDILANGLAGYPPQLDLLLNEEPLEKLLNPENGFTFLPAQPLRGKSCRRVRIQSDDGSFVAWIDEAGGTLERLELPVATYAPEVSEDPTVTEVGLQIDLIDARFGPCDPGRFVLSIPRDHHSVRQFVPRPPAMPSPLLGRRPEAFAFQDLDGNVVTQASLSGRTVVLMWFQDNELCRESVRQLYELHRRFVEDPELLIRAVCTEPSYRTHQELREMLASWEVEVPVVRDLQAHGRDVFGIEWAPSLVVLDPGGRVQVFQVGANPDLVEGLAALLRRLRQGEDLAAELVARHQQNEQAYREALESGGSGERLGPAPAVPARAADRWRLEPAWQIDSLSAPGNLAPIPGPEGALLALDGWQTVVEIDRQGQVVRRHRLTLPAGTGVNYLVSGRDASMQDWWLAGAVGGPQVHLFQADGRYRVSCPDMTGSTSPPIFDAMPADLDRDGQLEVYVAAGDEVGVRRFDLDGQPVWVTPLGTRQVISLTAAGDDEPALLATTTTGQIWRIDAAGEAVEQRRGGIQYLFSRARHTAGTERVSAAARYLGIAYEDDGTRRAWGLTEDWNAPWFHRLPAGGFATSLRFCIAADDPLDGWVIAGADGTVHLVQDDGVADAMAVGEHITGLAWWPGPAAPQLVVATGTEVRAWNVTGRRDAPSD